jgi:hypothetical protein
MSASVWNPNPQIVSQANASGLLKQEKQILTAGQRLITIATFAYAVGTGSLLVFKEGSTIPLNRNEDYFELTATTFLLAEAAADGDKIQIIGFVGIVGSVTTDTQLRSDLFASTGGNIVNFLQSGSSYVRSLGDKALDVLNVKDYGAKGNGVIDDTLAILAAIAAAGTDKLLAFPSGTYKLTSALTNSGYWIADGKVTLSFNSISTSVDCLTITGGNDYHKTITRGFIVDANASGREAVVLKNGDHPEVQVRTKNAQRDGFAVVCDAFDWVENAELKILTEANGRHGMRIELDGANGAFFNESSLELEVRGVSLRYNGGAAIAGYIPATDAASKVSSLHIQAINVDAQRAAAVAAGFDIGQNPIHLIYAAGGSNKFEAWKIDGGGFETTTGSNDFRSPYLILADSGVFASYWDIRGIVPSNWSTGDGVSGLVEYTFHSCKGAGSFFTSSLNGGTSVYAGYAASSTFDITIPIPDLPDNTNYNTTTTSVIYDLTLSHQKFSGSGQELYVRRIEIGFNKTGSAARWISGIQIASNITTNIASVNSVTISGSNLLVNVTTTAAFGSGGGDNHIMASLIRLGVGRV